jgi:hypothetical protein
MESVLKLEQSTFKDWYVYYKFIDDTGKLNMPNIKAGANRYKTKGKATDSDPLRDALAYLLEKV